MYILDGQVIDENLPQLVKNVQYPAGWFLEENNRAALALESVVYSAPTYNKDTHEVVKTDVIKVGGIWTQQWQVNELSSEVATANLAASKSKKWDEICIERDRRLLDGGFPLNGNWYYSDLISRSQYLASARKADLVKAVDGDMDAAFITGPYEVQIKSINNGYEPLTPTFALAIMASADLQEFSTYVAALVHKATMEASEDPANYSFTEGWPMIYGDV